MALCEMCGRNGPVFRTSIEGTILNVCKECAKHGKVLKKVKTPEEIKKAIKLKEKEETPEQEEFVVSNYGKIIRDARNKTAKTQKEFAQMLNEKESIIQKMETGNFEPSLKTARKFEKILNIKLVETIELEEEKTKKNKNNLGLTIGDVIKIKK